MIKKISAILFAILFCLCAVGCSADDPNAPEGMRSATVSGEPFTLYVPSGWSDNTASGISSAYYSAVEGLSVSARYFTPKTPLTKEAYLDICRIAAEAEYKSAGYELVEDKTEAALGKKDARKLSYKFMHGEVFIRCTQITTEHEGELISLYLYCPETELEARKEVLEQIRSSFVLGTKAPAPAEVITKDTPEGMKLASDKDIEYRLFVPKTWVCDPESGASDAYYPESGRPNISVTSFVPDSSMSVTEHFAKCEERYKTEFDGYSRTDEPVQREVGGRPAYSYTYTVRAEGEEIRIMQTVLAYDSSFYTITYTARAEAFDKHTADVDAILSAFKFR